MFSFQTPLLYFVKHGFAQYIYIFPFNMFILYYDRLNIQIILLKFDVFIKYLHSQKTNSILFLLHTYYIDLLLHKPFNLFT
jgi:hypothetical protein